MAAELEKVSLNQEKTQNLQGLLFSKILTRNTFLEPEKSQVKGLLEKGKINALEYLNRKKHGQELRYLENNNFLSILEDVKKLFELKTIPKRIECYDISHISGTFVYGSMVVFYNGKPSKKDYRIFKLPNQNNDFLNLQKVLERRMERVGEVGWDAPNLIIIDGGKGQLSSVLKSFNFEIGQTFVCSLAKRIEEVFIWKENQFIRTLLSQKIKFLFQNLRDEAHRFGVKASQNAKNKSAKKSILDEVEGLGKVGKQKLLQKYKSVEGVIQTLSTNPEEISQIVSKKVFQSLQNKFGSYNPNK